MRRIKRSVTFVEEFQALLAQGLPKFGYPVIESKRERVETFVIRFLAERPAAGTVDPDIGLYTYPVSKTPFVIAYDFDDDELRLHIIFHQRADRTQIDPRTVEWSDE